MLGMLGLCVMRQRGCIVGLVVLAAAGLLVASADARLDGSGRATGQIYFYANLGGLVPGTKYVGNTPQARPTGLLIFQDGSYAIEKLHWTEWGSSVAHATGISSSSTCKPDCASAPRIDKPALVTVSKPELLFGREIYSCYQLTVPSYPASDQFDCLQPFGHGGYAYTPVSPPQTPEVSGFYSVPAWYCYMASGSVSCAQLGKGWTAQLSRTGRVAICTAGVVACKVGNPGEGTPSLRVGSHVAVGPFRCSYTRAGLTCIVNTTGKGFFLTEYSVKPIG